MSDKPFLVTLLPSTDVDLGRWLLQHWQMPYTEHPHAPLFHILALAWYGQGKDDYPLLVTDTEKVPTIEKLVARFDAHAPPENRLVPDAKTEKALHDEVMERQHYFRWEMGNGTVDWAYYTLLPLKNLTWPSFTTGVPWWEKAFVAAAYPVIRFGMTKGLGLNAEVALQGLTAVRKGFDQVDALLADGRAYLVGERLTLADLAFCASAAPVVLEERYGGHLPRIEDVPLAMAKVIREFRERPAGAFINRIYAEERRPMSVRS
ncbi:glutathione binding-like protein [Fulvimarina sp. MAC8]|uniref:glutathione binding-like protein n=1 Tax=Fulvimarina sp. MAC8 TaxID=3162874 RepID=UPI0032EDF287